MTLVVNLCGSHGAPNVGHTIMAFDEHALALEQVLELVVSLEIVDMYITLWNDFVKVVEIHRFNP